MRAVPPAGQTVLQRELNSIQDLPCLELQLLKHILHGGGTVLRGVKMEVCYLLCYISNQGKWHLLMWTGLVSRTL